MISSELKINMNGLNKNKILCGTCTLNEEKNINIFIDDFFKFYPNYHLLIVDDNSTDKTIDVINKKKSLFKNITLIVRPKNLGLGSAHLLILNFALQNNYDFLVTLDADLSHEIKEIKYLLSHCQKNNYDFIIGSRYVLKHKTNYSGFRFMISYIGNKFFSHLFRLSISEFSTSFRVFRLSNINKNLLCFLNRFGYTYFIDQIFILKKFNIKLGEFPITFKNRLYGYSKINKSHFLVAFIRTIELFIRFYFTSSKKNKVYTCKKCSKCQTNNMISFYRLEKFLYFFRKTNNKKIDFICLFCGFKGK